MPLRTEPQPQTYRARRLSNRLPRALWPLTSSRIAPWVLTPLVLAVHGYHPFAGDAGIYTAGIRHILDPALYPLNAVFADAFTHLSVFAWTVAALVRITHLSLAWILLPLHLVSIWLFLAASNSLASRVFATQFDRWCAVALAGACCALPVAGTALVLMDPYVTARSFSTPLSLFAVAACLHGRWLRTALLVALAVVLHPLMGCYTVGFILLLSLMRANRIRAALIACAAAIALAGAACVFAHTVATSAAYQQAVELPQRSFLFVGRWHWYEVLGLVLPLMLFVLALGRFARATAIGALCLTCTLAGSVSTLIAALFVPPAGPYLLVPLQVLRAFHVIYAVGIVLSAGALGRFRMAGGALLLLLFAGMFFAEPPTWPGCVRIEWPDTPPTNAFQQAFQWIDEHTPADAVFAFDPQFVYWPGEDEQGFRALTGRDHLADDKDAGVVAVLPSLAGRWAAQGNAELNIDTMSDDQRRSVLTAAGATWLLLPAGSPTDLSCPYRNSAVQVCELVSSMHSLTGPSIRQKAKGSG